MTKSFSVCDCGATRPRPSRIWHCDGCQQTFTGEKAFAAHRRGRHGLDRGCAIVERFFATYGPLTSQLKVSAE